MTEVENITPTNTTKSNTKEYCDLCGIEIDGNPVINEYEGEEKYFCCKGCARVYEVARENNMLDQVVSKPQKKRESIRDLVFDQGETAYFSIDGMWCAGCATSAEQVLRNTPGVRSADVSFAAERGRLQYDPKEVDPDELLKSLDSLGYKARNLMDPAQEVIERSQQKTLIQLITAVAFGMQVMMLYLVQLYPRYAAGEFSNLDIRNIQYVVWGLSTPILFFGGISFLRGAWRALRARTATMDTLVALGTLSAYTYSAYMSVKGGAEVYFDSVAMITTFIMLGRYLETLGGAQARKDIRKLLRLQPEQAWRWENDHWKSVKAHKLEPGDRIMVKPGEHVPADAEVTEGQAALDESLLTGESTPVNKGPGDMIYAGTILADEMLIAIVLLRNQETRLAQITSLVDQTLSTKPPIQRLADRVSAWFAFGIIGVALVTFFIWWFVQGEFTEAVLTSVAVLVVACPCALGLATPLALAVTLGRTTRAGILVRNPNALENASKTQRIVFDKTGTLTRGELNVEAVEVLEDAQISSQELLRIAAAVEQYSEHPIARAVVRAFERAQADPLPAAGEFQTLRGMGTTARLSEGGMRVMAGSSKFIGVEKGSTPLNDQAEEYAARGDTVIWVGLEDEAVGIIALRDHPNATARSTIQELKKDQITSVLLSGDSSLTTKSIAGDLGLPEYEGDCPPTEKASRIKEWQANGEHVAMVGDGVNDAPALAQADLSIAMAGGTDIAGETSDVLLTRADLTLIPWFINRSRSTRRIIQQNLGWAFAYNLVVIPLAATGYISPVIAAAAMAASSLLVVGNSLRLNK